jgi:acyl carrier protein
MDNAMEKLNRCFALVFPKLNPSEYATANAQRISAWDSIAHLTLLTLIGEEFGRDVDFEEFEGATSYQALAQALQPQEAFTGSQIKA